MGKIINHINQYGLWFTFKKIYNKLAVRYFAGKMYAAMHKDVAEVKADILFSILVPLYNTPESYLREMIESVEAQTYTSWQLCLCDGSTEELVEEVCKEYMREDARICYKKIENQGIAENTNRCIDMADGDYMVLLDHDDLLHPQALQIIVPYLLEKPAGLVYTDEAMFEGSVRRILSIHLKPGYSPDALRANNYICHLTVFSKDLQKKVGRMDKRFDGSQDHDFILRLTEQAEKIIHVPEVLYFWRCHPQSVAYGIEAKNYAVEAGIAAVKSHLQRKGMPADIKSMGEAASVYDIVYHVDMKELEYVSVFREEEYKEQGAEPLAGDCRYVLLVQRNINRPANEQLLQMIAYVKREDVGAAGTFVVRGNKILGGLYCYDEQGNLFELYTKTPSSNAGYMNRLTFAQNTAILGGGCILMKRQDYEWYVKEVCWQESLLFNVRSWQKACYALYSKGKIQVCLPQIKLEAGKGWRKSDVKNLSELTKEKKWIPDVGYHPAYRTMGKYYFLV